MSDRTQRFLAEVGRFLAVGGAATVVALVIFNLLVHGYNTGEHAMFSDEPILAYVLANTVGMGVSYYGSRHWAFRDRPPHSSDGGRTAFVAINLLIRPVDEKFHEPKGDAAPQGEREPERSPA